MKTLEEFIEGFNCDRRAVAEITAAEILRVAEEWMDNDVEAGWDSAKELYDYLKQYIQPANTEGGE